MSVGLRPGEQVAKPNRAALVVGGGLAGMQASLLLAETGVHVYLVDRAPAIGGHQPLLDKTFPTDSCGLCFMSPRPAAYCPFVECERSENVSVLTSTEVLGMSGEPGNFKVTTVRKARGVDISKCNSCGQCADVCPVSTRSEFGGGLELRKAIYKPYVQAVPDAYVIDWDACTRCGECAKACSRIAVNLEDQDSEVGLEVGAVVLTTGFKATDAGLQTEYGYGFHPNVVTSIQVERMLSQGGPSGGKVLRPSDGAIPEKIAFIQCVGSRDPSSGRNYCSSICCMYAAKQTTLLRQRAPESAVTVFQMDLRGVGKGYEKYLAGVQETPGVEYRRSAVATVKQVPGSKDLLVRFVGPDGNQQEEQFSLVVLSVGVEPSDGVRNLAGRLGVPVNQYGFIQSDPTSREKTTVPGVFVAGGAREPMDVAEAVAEAGAAAASVAALLRVGLGDAEPDEEDVADAGSAAILPAPGSQGGCDPSDGPDATTDSAPARIAVVLCSCRGEIGSVIDLDALRSATGSLPDVAGVEIVDDLCTGPVSGIFAGLVERTGANRVVVAACARRKIEEPLARAAKSAGLDPALVELVNLREQCTLVHQPGDAMQAKAVSAVEMAVTSVYYDERSIAKKTALPPTAMVVGAGAAGATVATELAGHGVEVWLVDREEQPTGPVPQAVRDGLSSLTSPTSPRGPIHLLSGSEVLSVDGRLGAFHSTVWTNGEGQRIDHSIVVLATGVEDGAAAGSMPAGHPAVMPLSELSKRSDLSDWAKTRRAVAFLLCGGASKGYCSRTCCSDAVRDALRIKQSNPATSVFVLHRELRTYGFGEEQYEAARRAGVVFLRYEAGDSPRVSESGDLLQISVTEPRLGLPVKLEIDALVVATGVTPRPIDKLAASLGVELDEHGFLAETNVKTRSTEAVRPGVFLAGACQAPRSTEDAVIHAKAAAMRALTVLRQGQVVAPRTLPLVNERICSGCGLCVEACSYGARVLDEEKHVSKLVEALCQGCGGCASACPNGATQQAGFSKKQMMAVLDVAVD